MSLQLVHIFMSLQLVHIFMSLQLVHIFMSLQLVHVFMSLCLVNVCAFISKSINDLMVKGLYSINVLVDCRIVCEILYYDKKWYNW